MPSADPSVEGAAPRRSLLRRVVGAGVFASAIAAAVAAATAGVATLGLVDDHEEDVQMIAAQRLAEEIEEEEREDGATVEAALADELGDLDYVGTRGAVREGGVLVAGDAALPAPPVGTCAPVELDGAPYRACTVARDGREATLAVSIAHTRAMRPLFLVAALVGIGVGVLVGTLLGRSAVRWGLGPFIALREQVRRVGAQAPSREVLEPPADYVEIEELRAAIADLVERLGRSLSQAQRFAAQASHELRTPLTAIGAEVELLAETACEADAQGLEVVRARVDAMTRLVERLLVLAVPRDAAIGEAVDLADVAGDVVEALPRGERDRVTLALADDVVVRGDSTLLRAAFGNALENALKFSRDAVEVRVSGSSGEAWLEVADEGPGVSAAEREAVFEPFYRASASRETVPGSGIGLALIAHVAQTHDGRAEFVDVHRGACLRVSLPRWSEARSPA
jgi:signal transduction histidine kinase